MLRLDALLAAAELGAGAAFPEGIQDVLHVRVSRSICLVLTRPFAGGKRPSRHAPTPCIELNPHVGGIPPPRSAQGGERFPAGLFKLSQRRPMPLPQGER